MTTGVAMVPGQIWQDDCYYFDAVNGICMRKYFLVLAAGPHGDALTAVFTSRANGLTEQPACSLGPPRAGYFIGTIARLLPKPTWVDFSSLEMLDVADLALHLETGRSHCLEPTLARPLLCAVLRCLLQSDDVTRRQARLLADTAAVLSCP